MDKNAKFTKEEDLLDKEVADLTTKAQKVEAAKEDAIKKQAVAEEDNLWVMTKKANLEKEKANTKAVLD